MCGGKHCVGRAFPRSVENYSWRMQISRRSLLLSPFVVKLSGMAVAQPTRGDPLAAALNRARSFGVRFHSLIVVMGGDTLVEERLNGPSPDIPVNIKSVSKSIVSILAGIAVDRGLVDGPDARLGDVAPELVPAAADPMVSETTLADLLSLRAGLERTSGANYGPWVNSRNWVADALSRPFVDRPGGRMLYSTGTTHVLGAVLAEAAERSLLSMARDWLGRPLDIEIPAWTRDPQGYYMGGNEMALSPRAMVRIGEMMRRGGDFAGTRVLSETWVTESFKARTRSPFSGLDYGYGWFLGRAYGENFALARGYGGQVITIVPGLEMTIAITSDPTQPARSGGYFGDLMRLIENDLIAGFA